MYLLCVKTSQTSPPKAPFTLSSRNKNKKGTRCCTSTAPEPHTRYFKQSSTTNSTPTSLCLQLTPPQLGQQHGQAAQRQVHGSIAFYGAFFKQTSGLDWDAVCEHALRWLPYLQTHEREYVEEMRGGLCT